MQLYLHNFVPFILVFLALVGLVTLIYRKERRVLYTLRTLTILIFLIIIFEPIMSMLILRRKPLFVLVDTSKSMNITYKRQRVKELLNEVKKIRLHKQIYGFDHTLHILDDKIEMQGKVTDIGNALIRLKGRAGKVLLLTDGNNNFGEDPVKVAKAMGIPIYSIGIGRDEEERDIRIVDIERNPVVYAQDSVPVEITFENVGFEENDITFLLKEGNNVILERRVTLPPPGTRKAIQLYIKPKSAGTHLYEAVMPPLEEEIIKENNSRTFALKVLKSKISILYVAGHPSWNFKFMQKGLGEDPNLALISYIKIDKKRYLSNGKIVTTLNRTDLFKYDVVILEDTDFPGIENFVKSGKALILLGKVQGKLSPFIIRDKVIEGEFEVKFVGDGEYIFREPMPPLKEVYRVMGVKAGTSILGEIPQISTPKGAAPVIGLLRFDKGYVLGIASNLIWQWSFLQGSQFLRNMIRWLVTRGKAEQIYVDVEPSYYVGEDINFRVTVYTKDYKPDPQREVILRLKNKEVPLYSLGDGRYSARVGFLPPGKYRFDVEVKDVGKKGGEFFVKEPDLELLSLGLNKQMLEEIGKVSGGIYADELTKLNLVGSKTKERIDLRLSRYPLLLIFIIAVISLEWLVERRHI